MTDELLGKYIAGETSPNERAAVRQWLAENPDHPAELARFERLWQAAGNRSEPDNRQMFDTDAAWNRVRGQLHEPAVSTPRIMAPKTLRWIAWARVAAMVFLVTVLSFLTFRSFQTPDSIDQTATFLTQSTDQTTRRLILPDGSTVLLNRNSSVRYSNSFSGETREITLNGEAFFDVKPNAKQPFIIHAQDTDVRVVGTSFGVRAYDRNVRVSVKTGRVIVRKKAQEITLAPGQQATTDEVADTLRRLPKFDTNALAYSTKQLSFTNQSLVSVVETLSDYYQTDIGLSASRLQGCRLTARFENESVETVLGVVAETLQLSVKRTETGFVLTGTGCQ